MSLHCSSPPAHGVQIVAGSWLSSISTHYFVQSFLGEGTFGKVAKCTRMDNMRTVAIKLMRGDDALVRQANNEVSILSKLKSLDPDRCNLVRWYQAFTDRGHICLEFEHLDKSLYDFMEDRQYQPLLLKEIRPIVQQVCTTAVLSPLINLLKIDTD